MLCFFLNILRLLLAIRTVQMIKIKITANCKIKEKINNCLIQKQAVSRNCK